MEEDSKTGISPVNNHEIENDVEDAEPLVKVKAYLYLAAGLMIVFTPWILLLMSAFGKSVPLFEQIMYFCGAIIAGILGISPWALEVFKKK